MTTKPTKFEQDMINGLNDLKTEVAVIKVKVETLQRLVYGGVALILTSFGVVAMKLIFKQ
jgi:hypothetical protein